MTEPQRINLLENESAQSRQRLTAIEELLFRIVEANHTSTTTIGILAGKIDQLVDALLHPASNRGRARLLFHRPV